MSGPRIGEEDDLERRHWLWLVRLKQAAPCVIAQAGARLQALLCRLAKRAPLITIAPE